MGLLRGLLVLVLPAFVVSLSYHENGETRTVPLKAIAVTGEFFDCVGEVVVKQTWMNDASTPVTSNYKLLLDGEAVVSGFHISIGESKLLGVVKEKNQAQEQFNDAVSAGVKSSLLEKISDNDYQVQIGPIASYETATIEFRYLTSVSVEKDGSFHFVLPTTTAPKYDPSTANHPGYTFEVDLTWRSENALKEIVSPINVIRTEVLSSTAVRVHCTTAPATEDFSLEVRTVHSTAACLHSEEDGTSYIHMHNQIPAEKAVSTPQTGTLNVDPITSVVPTLAPCDAPTVAPVLVTLIARSAAPGLVTTASPLRDSTVAPCSVPSPIPANAEPSGASAESSFIPSVVRLDASRHSNSARPATVLGIEPTRPPVVAS
jgi:hypothetical protein